MAATTARTAPRDVLVASAVPGVEAALHAGNELYAAEMRVAERPPDHPRDTTS